MSTFVIFNIYLFYGLVFFSIGCVVLFRNFKYSQLSISPTLWALALFGFSHAFHEWSELYVILFEADIQPQYQVVVEWLRLLKLAFSFASLMIFAWLLFGIVPEAFAKVGRGFILAILAVYFIIVVYFSSSFNLSEDLFQDAAHYTRQLLGFGSAFLAGCGISIYGYSLMEAKHEYGHYFIATGLGLWIYGVMAGLVATELHAMVPVLRTLASGLILFTLFKALKVFDIEREMQTEAKLKRAIEADKFKAIGRLATGVAHEINNPLASSSLALDLLERKYPITDSVQQEYINRVRMGISRAADISKELLAYARPRSESSSSVNLANVAQAAIRLLCHKRRDLQITVDCDQDIHMRGQKIKLEELLINLLSNAMDASEPRGEILLTIKSDGNSICISVQDFGQGMDVEALSRATELFFSTKAIGQGTGLGLAICDAIVRAHDGEMSIRSELGWGTQVDIHFRVDEVNHD